VAAIAAFWICAAHADDRKHRKGHKAPGGPLQPPTDLWPTVPQASSVCACIGEDGKGVRRCSDDSHAVACASLARDYSRSGWAELHIDTSMAHHHPKLDGVLLGRAVGFVEGAVTAAEITELRARLAGGTVRPVEEEALVKQFADQQWPAVERLVEQASARAARNKNPEPDASPAIGPRLAAANLAYWRVAHVITSQIRGLAEGYRSVHNENVDASAEGQDVVGNGPAGAWGVLSEEEALSEILALNYDVDAFDITAAVRGGGSIGQGDGDPDAGLGGRFEEKLRTMEGRMSRQSEYSADSWAMLSRHGRCTAAVTATAGCLTRPVGKCDVTVAHTTWADYPEMIRVFKSVNWDGLRGRLFGAPDSIGESAWWKVAEESLANTRWTYSSYPGMAASTDDWLQLSGRLLVTETTISAAEDSALGELQAVAATTSPEGGGEGPPVQPFPAWMRSMLASFVAKTGADWARLFAGRNSGTSNSQWLIVDYGVLTSDVASLQSGAKGGLLWVLEQSQRRVVAADATKLLLGKAEGLWPGTNRPLFAPIREDLAYPAEVSRSPTVRAAAALFGHKVAAPEGVDVRGEESATWGFDGLWQLPMGHRLTDEEKVHSPGAVAQFRELSDASLAGPQEDVGSLRATFAQLGGKPSHTLDRSSQPWLAFGRRRTGRTATQHHLGPSDLLRFASVESSAEHERFASSARSRAYAHAAAKRQYDIGFDGDATTGAGYYSFDANPRAQQLRRALPTVTSAETALRFIRHNSWPMGSLHQSRSYFTPAARFDLAPVSDGARAAFGSVDGKAVDSSLMAKGRVVTVAGAPRGEGWRHADEAVAADAWEEAEHGSWLRAFDWREWDDGGVCGQPENPAIVDGADPQRACNCGPAWALQAGAAQPCCIGCDEEKASTHSLVPRSVLVGTA
jgi:hypothetical protein